MTMEELHSLIKELEAENTLLTLRASHAIKNLLIKYNPKKIKIDNLTIYIASNIYPEMDGKSISIAPKLLLILKELARHYNAGNFVTQDRLLQVLWDSNNEPSDSEGTLHCYISQLRKILVRVLGYDIIESSRYLGYRLVSKNNKSIKITLKKYKT
jgi:DNA-binding response OmpR family regulator